jgi:iron complex transport system substrate-binding protein
VRPDLVLCDPFTRPETLALLAQVDVPVVTTQNPESFDDIARNVRRIGAWCHLEEEAGRLVATMEARLLALRARAPEVAAFRVLNLDGALHVHGRPSLFDAVVTAAGAQNLAAAKGVGPFRKLDLESVLAWRPDVIVCAGATATAGVVPEWMQQFVGIPLLPGVRNGRVVTVPAPLLAATSHQLVGAAEQLQRQLLVWGRP